MNVTTFLAEIDPYSYFYFKNWQSNQALNFMQSELIDFIDNSYTIIIDFIHYKLFQ